MNTNLGALQSYNALAKINSQTQSVQLKLATMKKINSVADDTSGYRVGKELESDNTVQKAQLGNAGSAKNYLATAESSLASINDLLTQISAKYTDAQDPAKNKVSIERDIYALSSEIDSILKNTSLNGHNLLANPDGSSLAKSDTFDIGGTVFTADFANNDYLNADALTNILHGIGNTTIPGPPVDCVRGSYVPYNSGGVDIIAYTGSNTNSTTKVTYKDGTSESFTIPVNNNESVWGLAIAYEQGLSTLKDAAGSRDESDNGQISVSVLASTYDNPQNGIYNTNKAIISVETTSGFDASSLFGLKYDSYSPKGTGGLMGSDLDKVYAVAGHISEIQNNVQNALGRIGNLTQTVNIRSDFLSSSITNNTAAISRLFDTDMAAEQLKATKGSIAQQISTDMLSQLNSAPQQMLALFK
jgi:flagellin-like hook-associated protein FlgL